MLSCMSIHACILVLLLMCNKVHSFLFSIITQANTYSILPSTLINGIARQITFIKNYFKKTFINRSRKLLSNTEAKAHTKQFAGDFSSVSDWRFQLFFYKQETSERSYACINGQQSRCRGCLSIMN